LKCTTCTRMDSVPPREFLARAMEHAGATGRI